jgi:hypothetical protein
LSWSVPSTPVSKASTRSMIPAMECSTSSRVILVDCWFFVKTLVIAFIMAQTSLVLAHSSSLSLGGDGGGGACCPYFGGMVNRK